MAPSYSHRQISRSSARTYFMPPGAMSSSFATSCHMVGSSDFVRRDVRQAVGVGHVLVDEQPAPAALHLVEVLAVERDARADDLHVFFAVAGPQLARAVRRPVVLFELDLLLEQEVGHLLVGRELVAHGVDDALEEVAQSFLARFTAHGSPPPTMKVLEELIGTEAHDDLSVDHGDGEAAAAA